MPAYIRLTSEDRDLLHQAYSEGALKILETDLSGPVQSLERAGLMRSIKGVTEGDQPYRFFTLSGAGIAHLS